MVIATVLAVSYSITFFLRYLPFQIDLALDVEMATPRRFSRVWNYYIRKERYLNNEKLNRWQMLVRKMGILSLGPIAKETILSKVVDRYVS